MSEPSLAQRIAAATPRDRDRTVDALRAIAILGVVLGHWLVTAFVAYGGGRLQVASPLAAMPWLAPVSWLFQTLALFFFVGGYAGAKSYRGSYGPWLWSRMVRLLRPVPILLLAWIPLAVVLLGAGYSPGSLHGVLKLVLSPLWFLLVYAGLTALTPVTIKLWHRLGPYSVALPVGVVIIVDLARFHFGGPAWLGWANLLAGWLVSYMVGVAWARGATLSRTTGGLMLGGGVLATAALVLYAGYPASMVGVPGAAISNLNPPSLAAVTFGMAQVGLALLLRPCLSRLMQCPSLWAATALANLSAMTIFLWHQSAMIVVTLTTATWGILPGLHNPPTEPSWALERVLWLPAFATVLALTWALVHRFERGRSRGQ